MNKSYQYFVPNDIEVDITLTDRLHDLHERILSTIPSVDRIACASYDAHEDQLRTFIASTLTGKQHTDYCFKLSDSPSLSRIAETGEVRVIDELKGFIQPTSHHSSWLLSEGYHSSFTIPMYDDGHFMGLIFFDSFQPNTFTTKVQRDIRLYANLITMSISRELAAYRTISASVRVANQFMQLRDFEQVHILSVWLVMQELSPDVSHRFTN